MSNEREAAAFEALNEARQALWDAINAEMRHHDIVVRDPKGLRLRTDIVKAEYNYWKTGIAAGRAELEATLNDMLRNTALPNAARALLILDAE